MKRVAAMAAAIVTVSILAQAETASVYRWKDENGAVHITSHLKNIPEAHRAAAVPMRYHSVTATEASPSAGDGRLSGAGEAWFDSSDEKIKLTAMFDGKITRGAWVDTGSEWVTVTTKLATALGYDLAGARKTRFTIPGGAVIAPVIKLDSVRIGGAEVRDVSAAVIDFYGRGPVSAVIGMNFLSRFAFEIDTAKGVMTFSRRDNGKDG